MRTQSARTVLLTASLLAGCGGSQSPSALTQAFSPNANVQAHRDSWMLPGSSSGDLMYVAQGRKGVWIFSFPQGQLVGHITGTGLIQAAGLCSDNSGNVFVTEYEANDVLEYAHGGTSPINTLPSNEPVSCSWDPSTGNLAVVEQYQYVAIYLNARGAGKGYADSGLLNVTYCAYDDKSNLFIDGEEIGRDGLAKFKNGTFTPISLNESVEILQDLQWDGKYLAIDDFYAKTGEHKIYRVQVSGSHGRIVRKVNLGGARLYSYWTWLQDGTFLSPIDTGGHDDRALDLWSYPSGGKPIMKFPRKDFAYNGPIRGVTISVPPSSVRTRHQTRVNGDDE